MQRIALRLQEKPKLNLFDFYTLGKLIHYTADAFTAAHNESFQGNLQEHRSYESSLHQSFLGYFQIIPQAKPNNRENIMDAIRFYHVHYRQNIASAALDCYYCVAVTSMVLGMLFPSS